MTPAPGSTLPRSRGLLRHPLFGPLVAAVMTAALLGLVSWTAWNRANASAAEQADRRVRSNADSAARALQRQSDDFTRAVQSWAVNPSVVTSVAHPTAANLRSSQSALATLAQAKSSPAVFLTDLRGHALGIYPEQPELLGKDFSYRDWFQGVSRTGRPYVSAAYRSAASGHPLVVGVAAPVVQSGRRVGYLTALWQLESVRAVAEGSLRDDGISLTPTDQHGRPLTGDFPVDDRGEPQAVPVPAAVRAALDGRTSQQRTDDAFVTTRPVAGLGWTVQTSEPRGPAMAAAEGSHRGLLLTLAGALLLVLAATTATVRVARRRAVERVAAEDERQRLRTLLASSPIGIIEGLPDGTILAVNQAMADMLGWSTDQLLAMKASELAHEESEGAISGALQRVLDGSSSSYTGERVYRARDGSPVPTLVSVVVLRDDQGDLRRMVAFVVDQRAQKAAADELRALADTLAERQAFLGTLLDTIDVSVVACDADGTPTLVNQQVRRMHGIPDDLPVQALGELRLGRLDGSPLTPEEYPLVRALREGRAQREELLVLPRDGRPPRRVSVQARRLVGARGQVTGAVVAGQDVSALRAGERALSASEERFRRVFDEGLTGKLLVDPAGSVVRANLTMARLVGVSTDALVGKPLSALFQESADRDRVAALVRQAQGSFTAELPLACGGEDGVWARVAMTWLTEEDGRRLLLVQAEDVTARRRAEARLTALALHDELTGLPNRRLLMERAQTAFAEARTGRQGSAVAALFVDLDGFKAVNDRAGHEVGDRLLADVAADLRRVLRPSDTVARVGGDEFVVLVEHDSGMAYLRQLADRIGTTVRRHVAVGGADLPVSASVGVARVDLSVEPDVGPEQLLRRADAAMYRAKDQGRDRHDVFDADLRDRLEARYSLEGEVRSALDAGRVDVVYQPVVEVDSGVVLGAEALVRLTDAHGRLLPTQSAVLAAEGAGLVDLLGERVLHQALAAARRWPAHMTVAVNVSAHELAGRDLRARVEQALAQHDFDPARLVLEITESAVLNAGPSALAELERLRGRGVRVAIDDFGTAYANLQNLTTLPIDTIKVDASFTAGLPDQRVHSAVVHGVASMAYELDIPCIVEGVETEAQLAALRGMSVLAQGWLWGRPQGAGHVPSVPGTDLPEPRGGSQARHEA